jgi:8-oxo-dGTP pyrophosphatase MutT (NUDIX family)
VTRAAEEVRALPPSLLRADVLAVLEGAGDPFDRGLRPAHVTASAVVLDQAVAHVLLVRHRKLGLWLHPGGHVEPGDGSLADAARREAVEETGVADLRPLGGALDLHRHPAPCAPAGEADHLDVRFALAADRAAVPVVSEESTDVRWFALDALPDDAVADLAGLVDLAVARARGARVR